MALFEGLVNGLLGLFLSNMYIITMINKVNELLSLSLLGLGIICFYRFIPSLNEKEVGK